MNTERDRNELVLQYYGAVVNMTQKYPLKRGTERNDYIQEGVLGLYEAIDKYDSARGNFWNCAYWYVKNRMYEYFVRCTGINYKHADKKTRDESYTYFSEFNEAIAKDSHNELDLFVQAHTIKELLCRNEKDVRILLYHHADKVDKPIIRGKDLGIQHMVRGYPRLVAQVRKELSIHP